MSKSMLHNSAEAHCNTIRLGIAQKIGDEMKITYRKGLRA